MVIEGDWALGPAEDTASARDSMVMTAEQTFVAQTLGTGIRLGL